MARRVIINGVKPSFYRPVDIQQAKGNARKALETIIWSAKVRVKELVSNMIDQNVADITM